MKATVNKDSKCLIANSDHKNFTETNEVIEEGSVLNGDIKNVEGLRRGEPFTYRLFITKEGKILYGNIFENYHLCVPHIRKYVILVGCGKQHFNEVFVPYKNGYYVRVVDKISRFKVVDLASFHTYLTQIVESSQKSFQLFFNPDDLDIKKESLKICL